MGELKRLTNAVSRLENEALYVDLVTTSNIQLRVGAMPDVSKVMSQLGVEANCVVVADWEASQAGDNHIGEEFVQWRAQVYGGPCKDYFGKRATLNVLYRNLDRTFSYFFDPKMTTIVRKRWLCKWVKRQPVEVIGKLGSLRIEFKKNNILVFEGSRKIYDRREYRSPVEPGILVEQALAKVRRDGNNRDALEVIVAGSGNGFFGTSASFIARFGRRALWIDPCAQPAHSLARIGVHWDDVTDLFISHNHEDHILGFSACLKRKMDRGERLRVITAKSIYEVLRKQYLPLFPEMDQCVEWMEVKPGKALDLDGMNIITRWNHHFLPYGTLGLKITAGGETWGLSGDTKFDHKINALLGREELTESWFSDCKLIFHEVDFFNPGSVHTYWKELERIRDSVKGEVFAYHTAALENPPIPIAQDAKTYRVA
ncbi:MAG: hypothetical protein JW836_00430 [Deltaproteobacteria bacterium]|nr:hypothetical protein [Deltaproteobacteria bacterium]